jgi:hypothetical protein
MASITLSVQQIKELQAFCAKHDLKKFFMAKDQGAYIGAAATVDGKVENVLFYFAGCNPNKDADWYDNMDYKFGGDDFGEHFDTKVLHELAADPLTAKMVINVGKTSISMKVFTYKKAPTAAPKVAEVAAPSTKKQGIGAFVQDCIKNGHTNENILQKVKANFPNAKTTAASINWYRSQMRKA